MVIEEFKFSGREKTDQEKIIELKVIAASSEEPPIDIGPHCKKPHGCVYMDKCWPNNMNDINSVFRFYRMNLKKKISLYNQGIDTFEKVDGSWSAADYDINQYNRGEQVFSQSLNDRWTVNTSYLSDDEAEFLKNLYISPDVKVRFEGDSEYYPVIVEDTRWTERTYRKDKLFQNTCTFRIAHKLNSQRG